MAVQMKLTEPDAETVGTALRTLVLLMAGDAGVSGKAMELSGWSQESVQVEADYVNALARLASYIETVQKAG